MVLVEGNEWTLVVQDGLMVLVGWDARGAVCAKVEAWGGCCAWVGGGLGLKL